MFGFFKSKKSLVRQRLEALLIVRRIWFEWTYEAGRWEPALLVAVEHDLDPAAPNFRQTDLDQIAKVITDLEAESVAPIRVRLVDPDFRE